MRVEVSIEISKSKELIWQKITDIENSAKMISGIEAIEVQHRPEKTLVGFKWQETRIMWSHRGANHIG